MKRNRILVSLILLSFLFNACKKGEDDPIFTLQSRKSRLAGTWRMLSGEITIGIKDSTGVYGSQKYELSENSYTYYRLSNSSQFTDKCALDVTITKNGDFSIKQVMDSISYEANGFWDFTGKVGENKNKESIKVRLNSMTNKSYLYRTFNKGNMTFVYKIKELRNNKLVLENKEEIVALVPNVGIYITSVYTFGQ